MVGYSPLDQVQLTNTEHAFAGAISGAITRCISQPLDVLKIRFQFLQCIKKEHKGISIQKEAQELQVEPLIKGKTSKYSGIIQATGIIIQEEGWRSLWKGHIPAQILSVVYGVAQYTSFEVFTYGAWFLLPEKLTTTEWRPLTHLICGGMSGCVATSIAHPVDFLRTRFVAQGEPKIYSSLGDAYRQILRAEGVLGFYKGLSPALLQISPQMGFQFGLYSLFTGFWNKAKGKWFANPPDFAESLVCGSGSGFVSKFIIFPLDVVKKRLQVQGFESAREKFGATRQYSGLIGCLMKVAREEGVQGLFKGSSPGLLKAALVGGCNFSIYEQVCRTIALFKNR